MTKDRLLLWCVVVACGQAASTFASAAVPGTPSASAPAAGPTMAPALPATAPAAVAAPVPIEATRYGRSCLRIEARGTPWEPSLSPAFGAWEQARSKAGVQARWIQVVDHMGSPLVKNPFLPCDSPDAERNEAMIRQWVQEIHKAGVAAMSWYPLSFCASAWQVHPDWRQVSILPWPSPSTEKIPCCINSPYGDALIAYCNWAIEKFQLDGIWFDGSAWTPIWEHPLPLTCRCESCRAKFKSQTGQDIPTKVDWKDPVFRTWVAWRYGQFGGYIGRLAHEIRARHPSAAVVVNHYHRPSIPWHSAVPLDRYDADIISGSEAFSPDSLDLTMRLCRAYGRSQSEVWRPFDTKAGPEASAEALLQHALICYAAGGHPSYGGDPADDQIAATCRLMAPIMQAIHPHVGGRSLPYAAVHVSQQTETFLFGPVEGKSWAGDPYFDSLSAWTVVLGQEHLPPDYVYDADFRPQTLAKYKLLLMPLSPALTDAQAAAAVGFVESGGTLFLGVGAGQLDALAQNRPANPLGAALGFAFDGAGGVGDDSGGDSDVGLRLISAEGGRTLGVSGRHAPLRLTAPQWQTLYRLDEGAAGAPVVATRTFGKGRVMIAAVDPVRSTGSEVAAGGKTRLEVTDETAAAGKYSLKFVDDPVAPEPFYPDLETHVAPFRVPECSGGELHADFKVGPEAVVSIELRSTRPPTAGPIVQLGPQGKVRAGGQEVSEVPPDQWFHLVVAYDFGKDKPSTFQVTLTLPGGRKVTSGRIASASPGYCRTDWFVIFGAGNRPATFYLDNLELRRVKADGTRQVVHRVDFEDGPSWLATRTSLVRQVIRSLRQAAPPPIEIDAPDTVRAGVFEGDPGRVLVHLHNRSARREDWQQPAGPAVTLRCGFAVRSARLAVGHQPLAVRSVAGRWEIVVPPIGLYQVVELDRP